MKMSAVRDFEMVPVSLRRACRHQTGLQAHVGVAHLAIQFGLGDESRHGVHDQHIDGAGTDEGFSDFEGLFAAIG